MNAPELSRYFTVNNLYDSTTTNSELLWFIVRLGVTTVGQPLLSPCAAWDSTLG